MSGIRTGIELNDQFTSVIYGIINSVNLAVSSMEDMQQTMDASIDTSSLEGARDEINQATMALDEFNQAMQSQTAPDIVRPNIGTGRTEVINVMVEPILPDPLVENPPPIETPIQPNAPPDPVEVPVRWETDGLEVFNCSGIERFQQEVQSANSMLDQLSSTQTEIARQAFYTNLLPPEAFQDLKRLSARIDLVRDRIQLIENNPLNMGTDVANAELEQLRAQLNQAVQEQNELNQAMQDMDISTANSAYLRLSKTVSNTERYIRDNVDEQGRFNQEIQEGISQADNLTNTIKGAVAAYVSIQSIGKVLGISDELVQTTSRLSMMNDGLQTTVELVNMVYAAAQDARGSFADMASVVARFGNNARDAFSSSEEVVAFANLVQKQMTIAGASTTEASNAMLQLSQGLGSGVLRGDELNSIFEQAPNLIQNIADYLEVPIGEIREMASEGQLTADIVKAAIFSASDEINAKFAEMPMTWGQIWQSMKNTALIAFRPVLQRMNDIANSQAFQTFVNGAIDALATLANFALDVFDFMAAGAVWVSDSWYWIGPIIYGVATALAVYYGWQLAANTVGLIGKGIHFAMAAAQMAHAAVTGKLTATTAAQIAAQNGLNASMYACPIVWIIVLIIALIAIIYAVCEAIARMTGYADSGFGVIMGCTNLANQFLWNLLLTSIDVALGMHNAFDALGNNMKSVFHNAISSVQARFYDLLSTALSVVAEIVGALNKLPFIDKIDYSVLTNAADNYAAKAAEASGNHQEYQSIVDAFNEGFNTFETFQDGWASDAFNAGAAWGDGIADKISNFSLSDLFGSTDIPNPEDYVSGFHDAINSLGIGSGVDDIVGNTRSIADAMNITEEDLKYLRDIAEQEAVNRYTVAEVNVDMSGMRNTVNNGTDLDGFVSSLTDAVNEAVDSITEGVHE